MSKVFDWLLSDETRTMVLCRAKLDGQTKWFCRLLDRPRAGFQSRCAIVYGDEAEQACLSALAQLTQQAKN